MNKVNQLKRWDKILDENINGVLDVNFLTEKLNMTPQLFIAR